MPRGLHPLPALALVAATIACSKGETPPPTPLPTAQSASPVVSLASSPPALSTSTAPSKAEHDILTIESDAGIVPAAQAHRILHVGDSMVPLVGNYLRPLLARDGRRYQVVSIPLVEHAVLGPRERIA